MQSGLLENKSVTSMTVVAQELSPLRDYAEAVQAKSGSTVAAPPTDLERNTPKLRASKLTASSR